MLQHPCTCLRLEWAKCSAARLAPEKSNPFLILSWAANVQETTRSLFFIRARELPSPHPHPPPPVLDLRPLRHRGGRRPAAAAARAGKQPGSEEEAQDGLGLRAHLLTRLGYIRP